MYERMIAEYEGRGHGEGMRSSFAGLHPSVPVKSTEEQLADNISGSNLTTDKPLTSPELYFQRMREKRMELSEHIASRHRQLNNTKKEDNQETPPPTFSCNTDEIPDINIQDYKKPFIYNCSFERIDFLQMLLHPHCDVINNIVLVTSDTTLTPVLFITDHISRTEIRISMKKIEIDSYFAFVSDIRGFWILPNYHSVKLKIIETSKKEQNDQKEQKETTEQKGVVQQKERDATNEELARFNYFRNNIWLDKYVLQHFIHPYQQQNRLFVKEIFDLKKVTREALAIHLFARQGVDQHTELTWESNTTFLKFGVKDSKFEGFFIELIEPSSFVAIKALSNGGSTYHIGQYPWGQVKPNEVMAEWKIPGGVKVIKDQKDQKYEDQD